MQRQTYKYNEMRDTDIAVAFEHTTHVNSTNQWGTLNKVLSMNYYRDDLCFKSASQFSKSKQSLFEMRIFHSSGLNWQNYTFSFVVELLILKRPARSAIHTCGGMDTIFFLLPTTVSV